MKKLYINGKVYAGSEALASAFCVENGVFGCVGSDEEVLRQQAAGDEVIDLGGKFVTPGFIDSHMHVLNYGAAMEMCDLNACTSSVEALIEGLKAFQKNNSIEKGQWVMGRGFNQDLFSGAKTIPTRRELDRVSEENPVCITRCCGHLLSVNSKALELIGLPEKFEQPAGGWVDTDENGAPTGVFRDAAMDIVHRLFASPTKADYRRMMEKALKKLNSYGITGAHTDDFCVFEGEAFEDVIEAYKALEAEGKLTVRIYEQSQFLQPEALRAFLSKGYKTGVGTERFKIGPMKLLGDGSLGARTAFLSGEYADCAGERGLALFTQEALNEMIEIAHKGGMQVAVHAIGDGILDRILNAYERAFDLCEPRDHRSGIVHIQLTRPDQLERVKELKLHAYAQTIFIDYDAHIVYERAGEKLANTSYAFKTLKNMGVHVSDGTDCPVENPNPMRGIACAVTRMPLAGDLPPYRPEEAFTVKEALDSYTVESAHASFEENVKGRIKKGFLADFVILSENPFEVPKNRLHTIETLKTFVGGECVYERA